MVTLVDVSQEKSRNKNLRTIETGVEFSRKTMGCIWYQLIRNFGNEIKLHVPALLNLVFYTESLVEIRQDNWECYPEFPRAVACPKCLVYDYYSNTPKHVWLAQTKQFCRVW